MNPEPQSRWENLVEQTARQLAYPPTPDLAEPVATRLSALRGSPRGRLQLAWAWIILLALLVALLTVPPVRARVLEFLQIGAVRIWLVEPTATPASPPATPQPTPTPLRSLFDLDGETTLTAAAQKAGFPIPLPTYPANLGPPDGVFYQNLDGRAVILVWLDHAHPGKARLSLHILGKGVYAEKGSPGILTATTVNGTFALWTTGPYMLFYRSSHGIAGGLRHLVEGHVLIWGNDQISYRLETELPLSEAIKIAESLR